MLGLYLLVPMSVNFFGNVGEGKNTNYIAAKLAEEYSLKRVYLWVCLNIFNISREVQGGMSIGARGSPREISVWPSFSHIFTHEVPWLSLIVVISPGLF